MSLLFPKDDENTCFLRSKEVDIKLSLLFELCITVQLCATKDSAEGITLPYIETTEISCGWGIFPLFTLDGGPIENKTYDLKLCGGTPFEKDVPLPIPIENKSAISSFLSSSKSPRLSIRLWKLSKDALNRLK